jgi:signal peptidase II
MPAEGGYSTLLHGKVVDMFYFPIFEGTYPQWVPFWGGQSFIFFRPVFNIADSAITTGVLILVIFQRQFFNSHDVNPVEMKEENGEEITTQPGDNTMPSDK